MTPAQIARETKAACRVLRQQGLIVNPRSKWVVHYQVRRTPDSEVETLTREEVVRLAQEMQHD